MRCYTQAGEAEPLSWSLPHVGQTGYEQDCPPRLYLWERPGAVLALPPTATGIGKQRPKTS